MTNRIFAAFIVIAFAGCGTTDLKSEVEQLKKDNRRYQRMLAEKAKKENPPESETREFQAHGSDSQQMGSGMSAPGFSGQPMYQGQATTLITDDPPAYHCFLHKKRQRGGGGFLRISNPFVGSEHMFGRGHRWSLVVKIDDRPVIIMDGSRPNGISALTPGKQCWVQVRDLTATYHFSAEAYGEHPDVERSYERPFLDSRPVAYTTEALPIWFTTSSGDENGIVFNSGHFAMNR